MTVAYALGALAFVVIAVALNVHINARLTRRAALSAQSAIPAAESLCSMAAGQYLRNSSLETWMAAYPDARSLALTHAEKNRLPSPELRERYAIVEPILKDPAGWVDTHNEAFVQERCDDLSSWFDNRLAHPLTDEQRRAVVTDEDANLVVAGAGSGKTVTVVAKLAYLIEQLGVNPADILVLAFNKTVAQEIADRISALGLPAPEVSTFHSKGLQVLARATGRKPAVSALAIDALALRRFIESVLATSTERREFRDLLARWWVDLRVEAWELKQDSPDERLRKERSLGLRTLDGTLVRSQSEVKVGDWLTLHGIAWEYEARYPHSPPSQERSDYTPDFYLSELDIWIEVWACDEKERKFPPEIAAEQYRTDMEWKRALHGLHGTALLEINQTDIWGGRLSAIVEGRLREILDERHRAAQLEQTKDGHEIEPLEEEAIEAQIQPIRSTFNPFINLIAAFLNLFRGGGWDRSEVTQRAESERDRRFLEIFWPFLDAYEAHLRFEGKIDFDAMLIEAARALEGRADASSYEYIVVDEYQDTSRARYELIRRLRGRPSDCQLFFVGDDWQSIYRFTGADVTYFTQVERYFGKTVRTDLGRTFRLTSDVAELSTRFIMKNPHQLAKRIEPRRSHAQLPGVSIRLHRPGGGSEAVKAVLDEIAGEAGEDSTVLVLARYNFTLDEFTRLGVDGPQRSQALTVHRAKGLEADHVIVIDLRCGTLGFPTEIEDDPVLRLLLGEGQHFPNAEERRLFYVALTRARSRVYLLGDASETSPFIQELLGSEYAGWVDLFGDESQRYRCPRCRGRTIQRREGPYGAFWGCMHYPACRGTLPACGKCGVGVMQPVHSGAEPNRYHCTRCDEATEGCPGCGFGALIEREGPHGPFLGCSEWRPDGRGCDHTEHLHASTAHRPKHP